MTEQEMKINHAIQETVSATDMLAGGYLSSAQYHLDNAKLIIDALIRERKNDQRHSNVITFRG